MVTSTHETSHRIFQEHPEVLTPVFEALGVPPPAKAIIEALTPDATEIRPLERRVDTVLKVAPSDGEEFLLAIESQSRRAPAKATSWAYYAAHLHAKYDLPVLLVVVCNDRTTATWAAGPFSYGVGTWTTQVTHPFVLGPDNVPEITDESMMAQQPALATLSAIVHSKSRETPAILEMLARGMRSFDRETTQYWCELLEIGLENTPAKETWRELMAVVSFFPGRGTLFEQRYLEGQAEGKAEDRASLILRVLEKRGIPFPESVRERITSCTDLDTLTLWFDRSLTAATADELFSVGSDAPQDDPAAQA
jgi:hypothetical protein